jgi:hypothetical protein
MPSDVFLRSILGVTLQDGPINLLCPEFNLMAAKTESTIIKAEINMKVIRLATPSIIDHLFNQLCLGYSKEPHAALNHIRQMVLENSIYVIKCPQAGDACIAKNARRTIDSIHAKHKKHQQDSKKRKNLATANYADFEDKSKEHIKQQVLQSVKVATNAASVSSSITGITGATSIAFAGADRGRGCGRPVVFLYYSQVLQTETHCPLLPVAIQSVMPHITLQLGTNLDCSNCLCI